MKSTVRKLLNRCFSGLARKEDLDHLYNQIAGLLQIQNAMQGNPVLRPMRGWAMSPDAMSWILAELQEHSSPTVIEFGSGQSTIVMAAALKHRRGKLISVEHDPEYSAVIQRQARVCGVSDVIQFTHAPLVETNEQCKSYDVSMIPDFPIHVALIDGPPMMNGVLTRLIPLRWSVDHVVKGGSIFLDDAARNNEQDCLRKLKQDYPDLITNDKATEKGLVEIKLSQ